MASHFKEIDIKTRTYHFSNDLENLDFFLISKLTVLKNSKLKAK